MASDAWATARERLAAFFARGADRSADRGAVDEQLRSSQAELVAALEAGDDDTAADVADEWRARLRRLLRADPAAADELRSILRELGSEPAHGPTSVVHNTINGGVYHGAVVQGRDMRGFALHDGPPAAPDPRPPVG
jgi:hypothetical protein